MVKTPIPAWQLTTTDDGKSIALRQRGERAPPEVLEAFYEQKRSAPVNPGGAASSSTAGATVDTLRRWSCKVTLTQLVEVKREEQLSASACQPEGAPSHPTSPEVRLQPVKEDLNEVERSIADQLQQRMLKSRFPNVGRNDLPPEAETVMEPPGVVSEKDNMLIREQCNRYSADWACARSCM